MKLAHSATGGVAQPTVQCWLYDVSELSDDATFKAAMASLPWEERRAKVLRYRFKKDQCLSLGAGLLCAHALQEAGVDDLTLGFGTYNKPYLLHCPNIHFNLSHSGTMVLCAVASQEVGADVEKCHEYDSGVADYAFAHSERSWIQAQDDSAEAFSRMWVRKESYLKLQGTGLTDDIKAFAVEPGSASERDLLFWEQTCNEHYICVCTRHVAQICLQAYSFAHDPSAILRCIN